jgi:hypothetical protein
MVHQRLPDARPARAPVVWILLPQELVNVTWDAIILIPRNLLLTVTSGMYTFCLDPVTLHENEALLTNCSYRRSKSLTLKLATATLAETF